MNGAQAGSDAHDQGHHNGHNHAREHDHVHGHSHPGGLKGLVHGLFVPHSHDTADSIDDALTASGHGVRAVKVSMTGLGATAGLQVVVAVLSGSVALLADTVHNFSDALTAVPLWIAFVLGRRAPTRSYPYGFGRAEDLAGLFIVAMIFLSAVVAGYESIRRLVEPQPLEHLGWVLAAGMIGFIGNELVAIYRIRTGRRIGSAALVADGMHARTDGLTSLAVVVGSVGTWLGVPVADPIMGLLITIAITVLLIGTIREVGKRLLDGVDPALMQRGEHALSHALPSASTPQLALRWSGHRLHASVQLDADHKLTIGAFQEQAQLAEQALRTALPHITTVEISPRGAGWSEAVRASRPA